MSSSSTTTLSPQERDTLLALAAESIEYGLNGKELAVEVQQYSIALQQKRASFVTLNLQHQLRGCIGMLDATRPVVLDVVSNARAAAFDDPRFPVMTRSEFEQLDIHISLLTVPEPMQFESEHDLIQQLRAGVDGLILEEGRYRGTFLPAVWESLPEPHEFLRQLKRKAGLDVDYWSDNIRIQRYITEAIP